ncbi:MAG: hypothetical protein JWO03_1078 [Bacteroidetes bacterium]|nr:hypothetical protein [Bacteroidota bacterium]
MSESNECVTESEQYLKFLCDQTFLSLWSYANVYRDQKNSNNPQGKELCDLLVVFGDDVIIFSDKRCEFPRTGDLTTDWNRWHKKTVLKSADQAWGAERWIRNYPDRLFLDRKCTTKIPLELPSPDDMKIHIILVSHEVSERCREEIGGSGSLMLGSSTMATHIGEQPFFVTDLNTTKTFVHILDDTTLDVLMGSLTTVTDFVSYLNKKEKLFRLGKPILVHGEENLLGYYLENINEADEHDFPIQEEHTGLEVQDGIWERFENRPERLAQLAADKISYVWDKFIEKFTYHLKTNTLHYSSHENVYALEKALRFLSSENRTQRRVLSTQLLELLNKANPTNLNKRFAISEDFDRPSYVFIVMEKPKSMTQSIYRSVREKSLHANCMALKYRYPEVRHIVGIAIGTNSEEGTPSEDLEYLDAREWNDELQKEALELMKVYHISIELPEKRYLTVREYPEVK